MSHTPGRYDIRYYYDGKEWSVEVFADSFEEAEARLVAIEKTGEVVGRITETVYLKNLPRNSRRKPQ